MIISNNCYYNGSNWIYKATDLASSYFQYAGTHNWRTAASGTAGNAITWIEAMTLNASGFLGIGQTSPICYLDVYGGGAYTYARFYRSDEAGYGGRVGTGNTLHSAGATRSLGLDGFSQISFGIAGAQKAQIDSSGNLLVGVTSPSGRITVQGASADLTTNSIYAFNSAITLLFQVRNDGAFNTGTAGVSPYNNTTATSANLVVASDGFLARSTSARKYKQDIRDLESIDISKFRPVRYKSKSANDDQTKDHFGIIADEVDEVGIKELVTYGTSGQVEGFQYERLTVVLLKELQTLRAEFDAYKATHL